jgi:uncharacterized protein
MAARPPMLAGKKPLTLSALSRRRRWSPYAVGTGLGILSAFAFLTADQGLGVTSAFEQAMARLARPLLPEGHAYFVAPGKPLTFGWEWMLVVGVFFGAMLSSVLSRDRPRVLVPDMWQARFGASVPRRLLASFAGGALMMFGARLAQGCTSGHGITGALQLAASSWLFLPVMFGAAAAMSFALYGTGRRHHAR